MLKGTRSKENDQKYNLMVQCGKGARPLTGVLMLQLDSWRLKRMYDEDKVDERGLMMMTVVMKRKGVEGR